MTLTDATSHGPVELIDLTDLVVTRSGGTADVEVAASKNDRRRWVSRLAPLRRPIGYFVASRVAVLFAALTMKWLFPRRHPLNALATGWDGRWYTMIAQHGYPHQVSNAGGARWAFFPAFPAAIRAISDATRLSIPRAALVASFVFGLTSAVAVWFAVRELFGPVVADRSVLLYVFFPPSYVLSMAYTEGLFLTAAGFCLFALSRHYWISAALFAALASVTRSFGIILIACVAVAAIPVILKDRKLRPFIALVISPLGFLAWLAYGWGQTGTPLAFITAEKFWNGAHFVWFLAPLSSAARLASGIHAFTHSWDVMTGCALAFAFVGLALLWRTRHEGIRVPLFWWVFTIGTLLAMMSPYWTMSILRYSMAAFPLFAAFAWKMRPSWMGPIVGMLATAQGALAVLILVGSVHPSSGLLFP